MRMSRGERLPETSTQARELRDLRNLLKWRIFHRQNGGRTAMADTIPASEFSRNFGRYSRQAQREPVAVSSHGSLLGYFVSAHEFEELQRYRQSRRSFATAQLPDDIIEEVRNTRMDERHAHLDILLDPK